MNKRIINHLNYLFLFLIITSYCFCNENILQTYPDSHTNQAKKHSEADQIRHQIESNTNKLRSANHTSLEKKRESQQRTEYQIIERERGKLREEKRVEQRELEKKRVEQQIEDTNRDNKRGENRILNKHYEVKKEDERAFRRYQENNKLDDRLADERRRNNR